MGDARGFVDALGGFVVDLFQPLADAVTDAYLFTALLKDLGWPQPNGDADLEAISDYLGFLPPLAQLVQLVDRVRESEETSNEDLEELASKATDLIVSIAELAARPVPANLPSPLNDPDFWAQFAETLVGLLVAYYLRDHKPVIYAALFFLGVIEELEADEDAGRRITLRWDRLPGLLTDPVAVMTDVYGWGGDFKHRRAILAWHRVLNVIGVAARRAPPEIDRFERHYGIGATVPDGLRELWVPLVAKQDSTAPIDLTAEVDQVTIAGWVEAGLLLLPVPQPGNTTPAGLALMPYAYGGLTEEIPVSDSVVLRIAGTADATATTGLVVLPGSVSGFVDLGALAASLGVTLAYEPDEALVVLGGKEGTRLLLAGAAVGVSFALSGNEPEVRLELEFTGLEVVLDFGAKDGFLGKLLGAIESATVKLDGVLSWSSKHGLVFHGSGGLRLTISLQVQLGPIWIESIDIGVDIGDAGGQGLQLGIYAAVTFNAELGPFAASVERIGARLNLVPSPTGSFGGLQPQLGFRPPDGAGLSLDVSVVKGGGFILADTAAGKYAGILQLDIVDYIAIKAICLVATKKPDGSPGFSLLVIITAEFPPINIGYGFTLNGLGGLFGANRAMSLDTLRAGVRTRVLDSILFPKDPVARAPQIIATLEAVFPQAEGYFTFGVMVGLGWGSGLLKLEIGIILQVPSPIRLAILGRLSVVLPAEDAAVISLKMDILGAIDFDKGDISIDATIYDSRIAIFTITGDMAMRLSVGASPAFGLSAGGFHPHYDPPPGFPSLRRLAIGLATGDNPRLSLEAYMAVTPNSVQKGARLDVSISFNLPGLGSLSAGAYLGFDAILYLQPRIHFTVDIYGNAEIKHNDKVLFSADLMLSLSGPDPWAAVGHATVNFLGRHSIELNVMIGNPPLPPILLSVDPLGDLLRALSDPRNWTAQAMAAERAVVSIRTIDTPNVVLAHPLGELSVHQRVLPLDMNLQQYAGAQVAQRFTLTGVSIGGSNAMRTTTRDAFSPGQFLNLTEDQKISRPSFEQLPSGLTGIGAAGALSYGAPVNGGGTYESVVVDAADRVIVTGYAIHGGIVSALARQGGPAVDPYAAAPLSVALAEPEYRLVSTNDLSGSAVTYASWVEAEAVGGAGLQIVGAHEGVAP